MRHHAFVVEQEVEEGVKIVQEWIEKELAIDAKANPDVIVLKYGLFSVADARRVNEIAMQVPLVGKEKAIIIACSRAYHEAQNALLKLFEEPVPGTYLFLIMPSLGGLLPTLRSRVQVLKHETRSTKSETNKKSQKSNISEVAEEFLKASREKRSAMIKKLTSGRDEEERRELRDEAIKIVNGIEAVAYKAFCEGRASAELSGLLSDIATLRGYLYDRSAPVRMILEHLSIVIPKNLV